MEDIVASAEAHHSHIAITLILELSRIDKQCTARDGSMF